MNTASQTVGTFYDVTGRSGSISISKVLAIFMMSGNKKFACLEQSPMVGDFTIIVNMKSSCLGHGDA